MKKFYVLKSDIQEKDFKVVATEYDTKISNAIGEGFSISHADVSSYYIEFERKGKNVADYMYYQVGLPIISKKFKDLIDKELEDEANYFEFRKIFTNIDSITEFYVFNVLGNLGCLDVEKSNIKYFDETDVIEKADNIHVIEEIIGNRNIFRIDKIPTNYIISERFKNTIESASLHSVELVPLNKHVDGF